MLCKGPTAGEDITCTTVRYPFSLTKGRRRSIADRLSRAGVPVELHMYPRAYHGFYRVTNARVTKQAEHDNREALRRFLHG